MLTQPQIDTLWQDKMCAEARANYFGELATREGTIKRWITGSTFFLSSAAVVTLMSKMPSWVPIVLSISIAVVNGYTIAVNQDGKLKTLGRLHIQWLQLEHDYNRLWSHTADADSETLLDRYLERERELSETAATEIGHDEKRWLKWLDLAHKKHDTTVHA
jgi:hypothetical protein